MEDIRPGLLLTMLVLSLMLRFNGAILIHMKKKKVPILSAILLDILSPILCLATVSYTTGNGYQADRDSPVKATIALMVALVLSQFITGMIFVGGMYVLDLPIPNGRALGPASDGGTFDAIQILFLVAFSSILLLLMLQILRPQRHVLDMFKGKKLASNALYGLLLLVPVILISTLLLRWIENAGIARSPSMVSELDGALDIGYMGLAIVVFAPLIEELLFRGHLFELIRPKAGPAIAIIITAWLFALAHFNLATIIPIFAMGLLMGWLRERSGSIVPSMIFHAANNLLALALMI